MIEELELKPFKPLSKRSKFAKPNDRGQIPKDCICFNFSGKHCRYFKDLNDINSAIIETDCILLQGQFCERYRGASIWYRLAD